MAITGWNILDPIVAIAVARQHPVRRRGLVGRAAAGPMDTALPTNSAPRSTPVLGEFSTRRHVPRCETRESGHIRFVQMHMLVPGDWSAQGPDLAEQGRVTSGSRVDDLFPTIHIGADRRPPRLRGLAVDETIGNSVAVGQELYARPMTSTLAGLATPLPPSTPQTHCATIVAAFCVMTIRDRRLPDGNSLGRPLAASAQRLAAFVTDRMGQQADRGWDESWYELPLTIGDRLGEVVLGRRRSDDDRRFDDGPAVQTRLRRAQSRPGWRSSWTGENFPTDRYLIESIAADRRTDAALDRRRARPAGVTTDDLAGGHERTALVVLSHVAYRLFDT